MPDSSTILLVDDEDAVQKLLAYPLERDGFRVLQARDGEEALRRFDEEAVDLVVLDLMIPKIDGLEVCKRLRAASAVPIIMLTARDDELDKVLGLELGADDYITKPFSIREFRTSPRSARPRRDRVRRPAHRPRSASRRPPRDASPAHVRRVRAAARVGGEPGPRPHP
jgi:DNA-binding response OmpR family regulator